MDKFQPIETLLLKKDKICILLKNHYEQPEADISYIYVDNENEVLPAIENECKLDYVENIRDCDMYVMFITEKTCHNLGLPFPLVRNKQGTIAVKSTDKETVHFNKIPCIKILLSYGDDSFMVFDIISENPFSDEIQNKLQEFTNKINLS